jgi:membrane-bound lytic murein transglycosylase D
MKKTFWNLKLNALYAALLASLVVNMALIFNLRAGGFHNVLFATESKEWMGIPYALGTENHDLFGWNLPNPDELAEGNFGSDWILPYRLNVPKVILSSKEILADSLGRIIPEFQIADNMKERVAFWFDIYTKYDFSHRVVHHSRYPWIIFDVVDISPELDGKGAKWYRVQKGEKRVAQRFNQIKRDLLRMSKKSPSQWTAQERAWADMLETLPGKSIASKARFAASRLRTQTGQKDHFREALIRGEEYFPAMEEIFKEKGLPVELTRLPLVESSFNLDATSKVGASGIWQIMPEIGGRLMKVNGAIDERLSPLKSTRLAARLFKENHLILYRKWPLAVTAYNHGPGGVRKAAKAAGSHDLGTIIKRYQSKRFGFASSNFFACFQAAVHAEFYKDHVFPGLILKEPLKLKEVKLTRSMKPSELKKRYDLTKEELRRLNPDLKKSINNNSLLPKGLVVFVPEEQPIAKNDTQNAGS